MKEKRKYLHNYGFYDRVYWMIARGIDQIPKDSNYVDERLVRRVANLHRGLNLLGEEIKHE